MIICKRLFFLFIIFCFSGILTGTGYSEEKSKFNLRKLADAKGLLLGAAVMPEYLDDAVFVDVLKNNFNYITPENSMKWQLIHPREKKYDFSGADRIVNFAVKNGMKVRGHTLTWHTQNPVWLMTTSTMKKNAKKILKDHIMTVVGHFKGKIRDWDVVNEPLDENGALRRNIWYLTIGPEYIELAFKWAHEADPKAKLFINDFGIEAPGIKSDAFYKLVKDLIAKKVPVDGVGMQFHVEGQYMPDFGWIAQNFKRFSELGVEIQITELDVRLQGTPQETSIAQHAKIYGELMKLALAYKSCSAFITWGVSDKQSWVPSFFPGYGYALLFDNNYQPKPAAFAVQDALSGERPAPEYFDRYAVSTANTRALPPFRAVKAVKTPDIDGKYDPAEWSGAYIYSLMYNQLNVQNFNPPLSQKDIFGTWRILFQGSRIYGLLTRVDSITVTNHPHPWDNDNFEVFYSISGVWKQIRTIVGQDWQAGSGVKGKAVWNRDGTILEFEVDLGTDLTGKTLGWNAALSDNNTPKDNLRVCQLYPIVGNNDGWEGNGFGEMTFQNDEGQFIDGTPIGAVMPFIAAAAEKPPVLDADTYDAVWKDAVSYPFAFNQLSMDQSVPFTGAYPGSFKFLSSGNTLFGLVMLSDSGAAKYDTLEIAFSLDGNTAVLTCGAGKDFLNPAWTKPAKTVWSRDKKSAVFMVELSDNKLSGKKGRFSIGILGVKDVSGRMSAALYPFCGYNRIGVNTGKDLGEIMTKKGIEFADILFQ